MGTLLDDLRYAVRTLRQAPGFAAAIVATLALGIGANTAIFSVVDAVLFRPLPAERPEELVRLLAQGEDTVSSYPAYLDLRDQAAGAFAGIAGYQDATSFQLAAAGGPAERVAGAVVSGNFFAVLGVRAARGRLLAAADDGAPGAHPVAVVSHRLWQRRFGGDPRIVGAGVRLNGHPFTIVGVAPEGFVGCSLDHFPDLWVPLAMADQALPRWAILKPLERRGFRWLDLVARLEPGVSLRQAEARVDAVVARVNDQLETGKGPELALAPAGGAAIELGRRDLVQRISWLLLGMVSLVLLLACADAAGLLLVRAERRHRDLAVRLAIGASRGRLARQLLLESVLLSSLGAAAWLLLATWTVDLLTAAVPPGFPVPLAAAAPVADPRVLAFTAVLGFLAGVAFGTAPALSSSRTDLVPALKAEARRVGGTRLRLRDAVVVVQVSLAAVLLVAAGLLLRTLREVTAVDPGFDPRRALVASLDVASQGYDEEAGRRLYERLLERLARIPGVRGAALAGAVPVEKGGLSNSVVIEGYVPPPGEELAIDLDPVTPGYFAALGLPLLRGRGFTAADDAGRPMVAVINQAMAERFWPGRDPLGRTIGDVNAVVVGVVANAKVHSLREAPVPMIYVPLAQFYLPSVTVLLRTVGEPLAAVPALRAAAAEVDPDLALFDVSPLAGKLGVALAQERVVAGLLAAFAALALALAASGLYGVASYAAAARTREFGIRMALGAVRRQVLRLVLGEAVGLALAGLALGLAAALALGRLVSGLLFAVTATDPATFAGVALVLAAAALGAALWPARRATRVEPAAALREE